MPPRLVAEPSRPPKKSRTLPTRSPAGESDAAMPWSPGSPRSWPSRGSGPSARPAGRRGGSWPAGCSGSRSRPSRASSARFFSKICRAWSSWKAEMWSQCSWVMTRRSIRPGRHLDVDAARPVLDLDLAAGRHGDVAGDPADPRDVVRLGRPVEDAAVDQHVERPRGVALGLDSPRGRPGGSSRRAPCDTCGPSRPLSGGSMRSRAGQGRGRAARPGFRPAAVRPCAAADVVAFGGRPASALPRAARRGAVSSSSPSRSAPLRVGSPGAVEGGERLATARRPRIGRG